MHTKSKRHKQNGSKLVIDEMNKVNVKLIRLLKNYPDRFELFHVKDMDKTPEKSFTCPGYGSIDFKKIFAQAKKTNIKHYIVEIDETANPITCVQDSISYLKKLRY